VVCVRSALARQASSYARSSIRTIRRNTPPASVRQPPGSARGAATPAHHRPSPHAPPPHHGSSPTHAQRVRGRQAAAGRCARRAVWQAVAGVVVRCVWGVNNGIISFRIPGAGSGRCGAVRACAAVGGGKKVLVAGGKRAAGGRCRCRWQAGGSRSRNTKHAHCSRSE